jgi:hypothetical protein
MISKVSQTPQVLVIEFKLLAEMLFLIFCPEPQTSVFGSLLLTTPTLSIGYAQIYPRRRRNFI